MIAKVTITNPTISGVVSSQEEKEFNYELLLTTIYKGQDGKSAYQIALEHGFVGTEEEWIASNKLVYKIVTELPEVGDSSIFYLIKKGDSYEQYAYNNGEYILVGDTKVSLDDYYKKSETYSKSEAETLLSNKVDKVNGKRLSTNDYTTADKNKLANIQEFAEKNVQPNWEETDQTSDSFIRNKPILFSGDYNDLLNKPDLDKEISEEQLPIASESKKGIVQLATKEEVKNGVDTTKAITPSALKPIIDTLSAKEISGTDNKTYTFDVSSLGTIEEIKSKYTGLESLTKVIVATDGILVQVNNENYFRIKIDGNKIRIGGIANVAISDDSLQTNDKSLIGAINEIFTKILVGGAELTTVVYRLRNTTDDSHNVYSLEDPTFKNEGFMLYSDKDCTIPYGRIFSNMSGAIKIDADLSIVWALNGSEEYISDKRIATELAVYNAIKNNTSVSTPDWNQNDETATDYIKNRTHYETIAEHVGLTNDEYDAKLAEGKSFSLVKMHSITIENSQCTRINGNVQEGNGEEFDGLLKGIYWGFFNGTGYSSAETNSTLISPMIKINGKEVVLNWDRAYGDYYYSEATSFDGLDVVMYGIDKSYGINGKYIYANGFVLKDYNYAKKVNGETMPNASYGTSNYETFLIDKTIYGEAPYTIDFYFECESVVKKLDEKFLPDGIKPKHKTGDIVVCTDRAGDGVFKVIPWEEYEATPSSYPDAIGLVADPVKRTFLFCELLKKPFASIANIKKYLYGYTSLIDGQDTYKRISVGGNIDSSFPAFYELRCVSKTGTIFYQKQFDAYTPALFEWEKVFDTLCVAFYDDQENHTGAYGSMMDRLIALKNGTEPKENTFFYIDTKNSVNTVYYSQLSSVGLLGIMDNYPYNDIAPFITTGNVPGYDTLNYNVSPVFGLYSEDEE
jgi:hypothetical protein